MAASSPLPVESIPVANVDRHGALAALIGPAAQSSDVDRLHARGCPQDGLRQAWGPSGEPVWGLVVPAPGRVGMLLLSPQPGPGATAATASVARDATAIGLASGLSLVQMLLQPDDALRAAALRQAGFLSLTLLHTMERSRTWRPVKASLPKDVTLLPCLELPPERVALALGATYIDTLDCPGLLGLRDPLDTLQGHRASGTPVPDCWCLVHHCDRDVGVLFVSEHTDMWDLIYVGLAPQSRGIGLGGAVLDTMLQRLRAHSSKRVRLCVDSKNEPAMRLYRDRAFTTRHSAQALIATPGSMQVG